MNGRMSCNQCSNNQIERTRYQSPLIQRHHDIDHHHDPMARRSKRVEKAESSLTVVGDGDVWVEKMFQSKRTGILNRVFESTNTGRRCRDEPPTGAAQVVYLKSSFKDCISPRAVSPARRSKQVEKAESGLAVVGDGDIWVEKMLQSTRTGNLKRVFKSTNTGRRCSNEPPTGAAQVVYLKSSFIDCISTRVVSPFQKH